MKIYTKNLYNSIYNACIPGLYAFVNVKKKRIYISYSQNMMSSISRNMRLLRDGLHPCKRLQKDAKRLTVVVLEELKSRNSQLLRHEHWTQYYMDLGYTMYRPYRALRYTVKIDVEKNESHELLAYVKLMNRRNDGLVVGVFDKMEDARLFVESIYKDMKQIVPIYADNSLTREYLNKNRS